MQTMKPTWLLGALPVALALAAACGDPLEDEDLDMGASALAAAALPQSFAAPTVWSNDFGGKQQWRTDTHVRTLADVNNDGRKDVVGFGDAGVYLALSTGTHFEPARFVLAAFGGDGAWSSDRHVRTTADINGDGRDDLIGFGGDGVWTALSNGTSFDPVHFVLADYGYSRGWRIDKHVRLLADVNNDRRKDIIAFGNDGVYLSLARTDGGFAAPAFAIAELGYNQGWDPKIHTRVAGDINGDGRADIVAFGDDGVWTALATTTGFAAPRFVLNQYGKNAGGFTAANHIRMLKDVDNDGKADIVAFGGYAVFVSHSTGDGGFARAVNVCEDMGFLRGWTVQQHPRFVEDLNGDGYQDLVGFGPNGVVRALGGPSGFGAPVLYHGFNPPGSSFYELSLVGDVDGDRKVDLVDFGHAGIQIGRSSADAPPPPPAAPSDLRVAHEGQGSLRVTWRDNSSNETKFVVNWWGGPTTSYQHMPFNSTSLLVSNLHAETTYCFSMHAENLYGSSAAIGEVCSFTNHEPPSLSFLQILDTSMRVGVHADGADWVSARLMRGEESIDVQSREGDDAAFTFTNLQPSTDYCVTASAGWGTEVQETTQCTRTAPPPPCPGGGAPLTFIFCLTSPEASSPPLCSDDRLQVEQPACSREEAEAAAQSRADNWDITDGPCPPCH
jgi:hypothetical protein